MDHKEEDSPINMKTTPNKQNASSPSWTLTMSSLSLTTNSTSQTILTPEQQTFPLFSFLPTEIRRKIWTKAAHRPRDVSIRVSNLLWPLRFISKTPIPALLHTCSEARTVGLEYYKTCVENKVRGKPIEPAIYVNPSVDIVCLPSPSWLAMKLLTDNEKKSVDGSDKEMAPWSPKHARYCLATPREECYEYYIVIWNSELSVEQEKVEAEAAYGVKDGTDELVKKPTRDEIKAKTYMKKLEFATGDGWTNIKPGKLAVWDSLLSGFYDDNF